MSSSEAQSWKVVVLILVSVEGSSMFCNFEHSLNISGIVAVRFICSKALNSGNEIIFFLANLLRKSLLFRLLCITSYTSKLPPVIGDSYCKPASLSAPARASSSVIISEGRKRSSYCAHAESALKASTAEVTIFTLNLSLPANTSLPNCTRPGDMGSTLFLPSVRK